MRAWERYLKLRLYGELQPANPPLHGYRGRLPNLQFIVWKFHVPTDPDKLPPDEAIDLDPHTGFDVRLRCPQAGHPYRKTPATSLNSASRSTPSHA